MLPVVDYSRLADRSHQTELREITHTTGFFYLTGHGVPTTLLRGVQDAAHRFFALPDEEKKAIDLANSPHFRGYSTTGGELTNRRVDWREQIDFGPELPALVTPHDSEWLRGPNQWPDAIPQMRSIVLEFQSAVSAVAMGLLRHWAQSLGSPPDVFDDAFGSKPASLMKLVHYPPRRAHDTGSQGVGAHKDPGVLTMLLLEPNSSGLQVQALDGAWVDAPPLDDAFVVNIGELLEVATGGYLRATPHRVHTPAGAPPRISVPLFFGPDLTARIPVLELPEELAARARPISHDEANVLHYSYGHNMWKAKQRAHPDVFAEWHSAGSQS